MFNLSLRNKLLLLSLFPLLLALIILMSISYYVEKGALAEEIVTFRTKLVDERKQQIKEATQIAAGIVEYELSSSISIKSNVCTCVCVCVCMGGGNSPFTTVLIKRWTRDRQLFYPL